MSDNGGKNRQKNTQRKPGEPYDPSVNFVEPWKPGQSGNPKGRPKGKKDGLRAQIGRLLRQKPPAIVLEDIEKGEIEIEFDSYAGLFAWTLGQVVVKGRDGDKISAIRTILEQTEEPMPRTPATTADGQSPHSQLSDDEVLRQMIKLTSGNGKGKVKKKGEGK